MKRINFTRWVCYALILFVPTVFMIGLDGPNARAASKEPIKVGVLTDLTGPASSMVIAMDSWGFPDYLEYINANGGVKGHPIEYTIVDTSYKMDKIITGYEKLKGMNIVALQTSLSPAIAGLKKRFEKDKICTFIGSATTEGLWPATYTFNTMPNFADSAGYIIDYLINQANAQSRDLKKDPIKLAWVFADNPMGRSILPAQAYAEARGCVNALSLGIPMIPTDTGATLRRVKAAGVDAIILGHVPAPTAVVLRDAMRVGLDTPFYSTNMTQADGVIFYSGLMAEGFNEAESAEPWYAEFQEKHPALKLMIDTLKKKHPEGVQEPWKYRRGWTSGMVLVAALNKAIEKKGWPITGEDIRNALDGLTVDMGGIQPPSTYYKGIDNRGCMLHRMNTIKKKQKALQTLILVEPVTEFTYAPTVLPKGYEAKCKGLKDFCKKKGWTYFSPESGLILGKQ